MWMARLSVGVSLPFMQLEDFRLTGPDTWIGMLLSLSGIALCVHSKL